MFIIRQLLSVCLVCVCLCLSVCVNKNISFVFLVMLQLLLAGGPVVLLPGQWALSEGNVGGN